MIVEDDPATRNALTRVIQLGGYEGLPRSSAEEAHDMLETCHCDLAVLDIRLPGQPGDEFGRELSNACHVPIIFVSGEPAGQHVAAELPGAVFLQKPLDANTLLNKICTLLAVKNDGGDQDTNESPGAGI